MKLLEFDYRLDEDPQVRRWVDPCAPCSDGAIVLRIAEHARDELGLDPQVVHLCWTEQPEQWSRVEVSAAQAAEDALWAKD